MTDAAITPNALKPGLLNRGRNWDRNAVLAALMQELYEECGGDWERGQRWLISAAKQFWPRTVEDDVRDFWCGATSQDVDYLIEHLHALPDDLRIAILAKPDAIIESNSACFGAPWSSSLINNGNPCGRRSYGARALDISTRHNRIDGSIFG